MKDVDYTEAMKQDPGWMTPAELAAIRVACDGLPGDALEIGCYCGRSTRALLTAVKGRVISIDPLDRLRHTVPAWPYPHDGRYLDSRRYMHDLVAECPDRLLVIPCFSDEIVGLLRWPFCVVFIDAEHTYQGTLGQIDAFAPLLTKNGILILDDWDMKETQDALAASKWRVEHAWPMLVVGKLALLRKAETPGETT